MTYDAETIIDYDYAAHKDQYQMPLNERASIFLPFAALAGFEEEIKKVSYKAGYKRNYVR